MRRFVVFFTLAFTLLVAYYAMSQQPPVKKSIESQAFIGTCACDVCECCE